MKSKMIYDGREVILNKEGLPRILIDVLQKDGDCPKGYKKKKRMQCKNDCGNTYLSFVYDPKQNRITNEGALTGSKALVYDGGVLKTLGMEKSKLEKMIKSLDPKLKKIKKKGITQITYEGHNVAKISYDCAFYVAERIDPENPEQKRCQKYIRENTRKVMMDCGLGVFDLKFR